jgi:ribose-phosphate pyrophosphokinase
LVRSSQLFIDYFLPHMQSEEVVVVSPDAGGLKRAETFRQAFSQALHRPIDSAFKEKH